MKIESGQTNRKVGFVAQDATDLQTLETGMTVGTFAVYYSIDGGTATAMTGATVTELDGTNMPGLYVLDLDESGMTTLAAGEQYGVLLLHIDDSGGVMAPVNIAIEIERPAVTAGETITVSSGTANADMVKVSTSAPAADNLETAGLAYSTTRGLAGTALPAAAADAAGGLPISDNGGLNLDTTIGALTYTTANQVDVNALSISSNATAATNLSDFYATGVTTGTVNDAGATATDFDTTLTTQASDLFNGCVMVFIDGPNAGIARRIDDFTTTSGNCAFTDLWPGAPDNGDAFQILGRIETT